MTGAIFGDFAELFSNVVNIKWQMVLMWIVGGVFIFLSI